MVAVSEERDRDAEERLRFGECRDCKRAFAWTGSISAVPRCGCGRQHDKSDFPPSLSPRAAKVLLKHY